MYSIHKATLDKITNKIREKTGMDKKYKSSDIPLGIEEVYEAGIIFGQRSEEQIPDDGKTRIFIHLEEGRTSPKLCCCPNGTVTIDWGDETTPDTLVGTSLTLPKYTPIHEYSKPGNYIITLTVEGEVGFYGSGTYGSNILGSVSTGNDIKNTVYSYSIYKIIHGKSVNFSNNYGGYNLAGLQNITISNVNDSIIPNLHFSYCYALTNVTVLDGISAINDSAFAGCYGIKYYDFSKRTTIPTLTNISAFRNISDDCEIRVPVSLYNEWIAATNWSTYADQIIAVEEE